VQHPGAPLAGGHGPQEPGDHPAAAQWPGQAAGAAALRLLRGRAGAAGEAGRVRGARPGHRPQAPAAPAAGDGQQGPPLRPQGWVSRWSAIS